MKPALLRRAFTLVELLVVVGVIAVLIALLMPVLAGAREAANRVKCLANLRSMAQAAHMHALEHRGYMPVAGNQTPITLGIAATPEGLADTGRVKYMWYPTGGLWRPYPLPIALGHYMGLDSAVRNFDVQPMQDALESDAARSRFMCPAQDQQTVTPGYVLGEHANGIPPVAYMGYIFNAAALGRMVAPWGETPAGNSNRIRRPSSVFLFADGQALKYDFRGYGVSAEYGTQETLFDRFPREQVDYSRHRGRINVGFIDGHCETLMLPDPRQPIGPMYGNRGDLERVGLSRGIFD